MRRSRTVLSIVAVLGLVVALPSVATPAGEDGVHKVTICHVTNSAKNPYVKITIDEAAWNDMDDKRAHGIHHTSKDETRSDVLLGSDEDECPDGVGGIGGSPTVSGTVWFDESGDGVFGGDDSPLAGATVYLFDASMTLISSVETGSDGSYSFDLQGGSGYEVVASHPWAVPTMTDAGSDDSIDSDFMVDSAGMFTSGLFAATDGDLDLDAGFTYGG